MYVLQEQDLTNIQIESLTLGGELGVVTPVYVGHVADGHHFPQAE